MSHYKTIISKIKAVAETDTNVKTVTKGLHFDINKSNEHLILHIEPTAGPFTDGAIGFTFLITAAIKRTGVKNLPQNAFDSPDSEDDSLDLCHDVLARLILKLQNLEADFDVDDYTDPVPIIQGMNNLVDGWQSSVTISTSNKLELC